MLSRMDQDIARSTAQQETGDHYWFGASEPFLRQRISYEEWARAGGNMAPEHVDPRPWTALLAAVLARAAGKAAS